MPWAPDKATVVPPLSLSRLRPTPFLVHRKEKAGKTLVRRGVSLREHLPDDMKIRAVGWGGEEYSRGRRATLECNVALSKAEHA